jgi:hypothetical protein
MIFRRTATLSTLKQTIKIGKICILEVTTMTSTVNLPCGCILNWSDHKVNAVLCIGHTLAYATWEGSKEQFVKNLATPEISK